MELDICMATDAMISPGEMRPATLIAAICGLCVAQASASHSVKSYTKKDGTYVPAHTSKDPGERGGSAVPPTARTSVTSYAAPSPSTSENYTMPISLSAR